jgi:hypothetical protein
MADARRPNTRFRQAVIEPRSRAVTEICTNGAVDGVQNLEKNKDAACEGEWRYQIGRFAQRQ